MVADVEKAIREYLPQVIHLSLATASTDWPWICEVHFVFDEQLNLYFRSLPSRRHSREIEGNARVAGNIVTQHAIGQKERGVSFEGTAKMLKDVDAGHVAYRLYCERFGTDAAILAEAATEDGHKFYKITVETFYLFDRVESTPSRKYELAWSRRMKS
jgi:uncharacterized protein YhbP (UPF0306 family)